MDEIYKIFCVHACLSDVKIISKRNNIRIGEVEKYRNGIVNLFSDCAGRSETKKAQKGTT